jgi:Rieske 2Fe-2S family protein
VTTFIKPTEIPIDGAHTLPREYFTAPGILAQEMEQIFLKRWICVGREDRIANPGEYFVQEIGKESIIVLHDRAGGYRAYYNVCRHRGTRLCEAHTGRFSETIQCPYHAWTYSLDGRLIGAPSTGDIEGFDKSDWPLHPVPVATWEGFLFINLAERPEPFEDAFEPLLGRFSRFNLPNLKVHRTIDYDVTCNWKLLFQNYSECYHCGPVHPALAKLTPPTSGENDLTEGPFTGGFMVINRGHESMTMSGKSCGVSVGDLPEEDMDRVYYYAIFPNMLLSLHPDYVMFHTIWPQGTDRSLIHCSWLFHPATLSDPAFNPDDGVEFWDMTNKQDWHICEQSQAGIESRAYRPGPYSGREALSVQFDREVLRSLGHGR